MVHAQEIVGGRAVIVDVVPEAFKDVFSRETVVFDLMKYLVINLEVVVVLIVEIVSLLLGLGSILAYEVFVEYVILGDYLFIESLFIL